LSQLYLNNEQDTIHHQEVITNFFQKPKKMIKPSQKLIEIIQGKKPPKKSAKCKYHVHVARVQFETLITIHNALNGCNVEEWKLAIQFELKCLKANKTWEVTII
jgi:hypothetical protein